MRTVRPPHPLGEQMSSTLVASLYREESALLEELRASAPFRRYVEIRRLIELYETPAPIGADLDEELGTNPRMAGPPRMPVGIAAAMQAEVA